MAMKTKLKILVVMLIFSLVSLVENDYLKISNDVLFMNIEVLAHGEAGDYRCFHIGSVICPFTDDKVFKVI